MSTATANSFHTVDATQLRVGARLQIPIYDQSDVLLLADGQVITPSFLGKLRSRGVGQVKVHEDELPRVLAGQPVGTATTAPPSRGGVFCDVENVGTRTLDELAQEAGHLRIGPQGEAVAKQIVDRGNSRYDGEQRNAAIEKREKAVDGVREVFQRLHSGRGLDVDTLSGIAEEALGEMQADFDLFGSLGANPHSSGYPARHSVHACMLSLLIGTTLELDRTTLRDLAIGCLIHDAGMLQIERDFFENDKRLDPVEFLEITKHPVLAFDKMLDMQAVSSRSAFVAYQIHERCDGSGYPRRRRSSQIHFLSKVAAVADAYVGLVAPRPHREALLPHHAVKHLLQETAAGLFDPVATRALLNAVSLFPVGSFVKLDDGRVGQTIRTNGGKYDRPTVEVWHPSAPLAEPDVVNLTEDEERSITAVLPKLDFDFDVENDW